MDAELDFALSHCDAIGFDVDHTIIRYRLRELYQLIFHAMAQCMVTHHDYPDHLLRATLDLSFCAKSIVVDFTTGDFLKLADDGVVLRAFHGTRQLAQDEVEAKYGRRPWQYFADLRAHRKSPRYFYFITYFDVPASYLLALIIDWLDSRGRNDYGSALPGLLDSFNQNFLPDAFLRNTGWYFPAIKARPEEYLYRRPVVREWLTQMHAAGVRLFLVTNSHYDYCKHLMDFAYGEDWEELFDIVVVNARKPRFFFEQHPYFVVDRTTMREAQRVDTLQPVAPGTPDAARLVYAQGNAAELTRALGPRILYAGDHLIGDVVAAAEVGWHALAIVEEIEEPVHHAAVSATATPLVPAAAAVGTCASSATVTVTTTSSSSDVHFSHGHAWGSFFAMVVTTATTAPSAPSEEPDATGVLSRDDMVQTKYDPIISPEEAGVAAAGRALARTLGAHVVAAHSTLAVPDLEVLATHLPTHPLAWTERREQGAYFPRVPHALQRSEGGGEDASRE